MSFVTEIKKHCQFSSSIKVYGFLSILPDKAFVQMSSSTTFSFEVIWNCLRFLWRDFIHTPVPSRLWIQLKFRNLPNGWLMLRCRMVGCMGVVGRRCSWCESCSYASYGVHVQLTETNSVAPEPKGSSPSSQQPAARPYPEPAESTPHPPPSHSPEDPFWSHSPVYAPVFLSGFPTKTLHTLLSSTIRATCLAHLILHDLTCLMIFGYEYKLWNFPLCNLLHSPVTSSFLSPNILIPLQQRYQIQFLLRAA
jgi:hypothetical protein